MKWFKHESSAGDSPRLRRLRAKYGAEGYGLYWFIVEQVGIGWETHGADLNPSLEMDDIEAELRIGSGQAPDMIRWMIDKGLFEASTIGLLRCESLRNHVGEAQRKAERRDRPKQNSGQAPDSVRIVSGPTPEKEEIRGEEKRGEKRKTTRAQAPAAEALYRYAEFFDQYDEEKRALDSKARSWWGRNVKHGDDARVDQIMASLRAWQATSQFRDGKAWNIGKFLAEGAVDAPPTGKRPPTQKPPRMETDMDRALARMAREMVDE